MSWASACPPKLAASVSAVHDFRIDFMIEISHLRSRTRSGGLVPSGKVSPNGGLRKFISQKGGIGFSDSPQERCLAVRCACAIPMKSRAAAGRPEPRRQTMPTCTTGSEPEISRDSIRSPSSDQGR